MIHHKKHEKVFVPFSNNRLFITFTLFLILGLPASFIPEETYGRWLMINTAVAVVLTVVNYILWRKHKEDSKRYFSLHSFVMLLGLAFFTMAPIFKGLFPSVFFWMLLIGLTLFILFLFSKSENIAQSLLNPRLKGFSLIMYSYLGVVFFAGSVLLAYMLVANPPRILIVRALSNRISS
ncbi:hypothetical protein ACFO0S_14430 [Chryseomicrobium palamuruense]|uniref:Uncharacterized protein n=1 Tax=Chryseomicrobium palamuruense TaxID=682973 RepID=A0ABV8V0C2_9BACL